MISQKERSLCSTTGEQLLTAEHKSNSLVLSRLKNFYQPVVSKGFAIKYVSDGVEHYRLGNDDYTVKAGSYLLSNTAKDGKVEIESNDIVTGVCINLLPELLAEVIGSARRPDTAHADDSLGTFFTTDYFLENKYDASQTLLGNKLQEIDLAINRNDFNPGELGIEFFYSIAETVIADQVPVFKQLQSIPSIKRTTKKDLYKRILKGREMIDASFTSSLSVDMIAKEACMSEYHFFRLFKQIYGVSPHQYIIGKRLQLGKSLMEQGGISVSEAAAECGFGDIFTFSKAYRNFYGVAPSRISFKK